MEIMVRTASVEVQLREVRTATVEAQLKEAQAINREVLRRDRAQKATLRRNCSSKSRSLNAS